MAGHPADEDKRSLRLAQITQYVEQLDTDRFEDGFPRTLRASTSWLVTRWRSPKTSRALPVTATFLEAWTEFQHAASEDERQSLISRWKPEEVSKILKSPDTPPGPQYGLRVLPEQRITRPTTCFSK